MEKFEFEKNSIARESGPKGFRPLISCFFLLVELSGGLVEACVQKSTDLNSIKLNFGVNRCSSWTTSDFQSRPIFSTILQNILHCTYYFTPLNIAGDRIAKRKRQVETLTFWKSPIMVGPPPVSAARDLKFASQKLLYSLHCRREIVWPTKTSN